MPCVRLIDVRDCPTLKALPALGKLTSLVELNLIRTNELHIGCEILYEVDDEEEAIGGEVRFNNIAFPKLTSLTIMGLKELEWEFEGVTNAGGSGREEIIIIMPRLRKVDIRGLRNLKPFLEVVSKMSSLEIFQIRGEATEFMKHIRHDEIILFPNLKDLWLSGMEDMEELKIGFQVMPLLQCLRIFNCNKLKAIQGGNLSKLETLELTECASVYELGIPNLKSLHIYGGQIHPLLPEAFVTTLQALEVLTIASSSLRCVPEQVQQLTRLKKLEFLGFGDDSAELKQRCRKDQGEDWRIISHIPNIEFN